jgi:hypothetical protein
MVNDQACKINQLGLALRGLSHVLLQLLCEDSSPALDLIIRDYDCVLNL